MIAGNSGRYRHDAKSDAAATNRSFVMLFGMSYGRKDATLLYLCARNHSTLTSKLYPQNRRASRQRRTRAILP